MDSGRLVLAAKWCRLIKSFNLKTLILSGVDLFLIAFSSAVTVFFFESIGAPLNRLEILAAVAVFALFLYSANVVFNTYHMVLRYYTVKEYLKMICAGGIGCCVSGTVILLFFSYTLLVPFAIICLLAVFLSVFIRMVYQSYSIRCHSPAYHSKNGMEKDSQELQQNTKKALIIGAGAAGKLLAEEMLRNPCGGVPAAFVDDDTDKISRCIGSTPVMGRTDDIVYLCGILKIDIIIFAIPSCTEKERARIMGICAETQCRIKTLPFITDMVQNSTLLSQAKDISIEDLLGRSPVVFENAAVAQRISGEVCLVTGGGGSIGSELCRQIAKYAPKQLIILDIYENNAYDIEQELKRLYGNTLNLSVQIVSVTDEEKMKRIFEKFRPTIIFHAAAHKHVPLMETNPEEAVKNNIFGTYTVARLALQYQVDTMLLVSTDKAVNPTNVMGATKRCCEMIMQYMNSISADTNFAVVRFGNVLGSNGSVIPLFRKQIECGGPVTVTHPEIIRYFMTIPEAVSLILQAVTLSNKGEIFVLDMGEPVKIVTLAEKLIRQYGLIPYKDIKIVFTGLRPGEKLYEELLMEEENLLSTPNQRIFIGNQIQICGDEFLHRLGELRDVIHTDDPVLIMNKLSEIVVTYRCPVKMITA